MLDRNYSICPSMSLIIPAFFLMIYYIIYKNHILFYWFHCHFCKWLGASYILLLIWYNEGIYLIYYIKIATIFLHAHLQVAYYKCVKFHKNPISRLGGVALTRICMKLYTVVVHNLQMCMKEYRCCLQFRKGDNSTYTFTKRGVVYLRLTDGRTRWFLYIPPNVVCGGYNKMSLEYISIFLLHNSSQLTVSYC
jgi:hypothetical protein